MSRIVSVFLPHLPIERLKRQRKNWRAPAETRPFALVGSEAHGLILTAVNQRSSANGLYPGLGLADARAICPQLLTLSAETEKDAAALRALARWCCRYSPTLNTDGEDGLWLDVTGVPHLFGGEAELLADMAEAFRIFGFSAKLALAETIGAAHALAHFSPQSSIVVREGQVSAALARLPVEALRLDADVVLLLKRLGLKRIGQLYDLPRASLEQRFHSKSQAEAVLLRLDQALGRRKEKRVPRFPPPRYEAVLLFAEPLVTHEGVIAGLTHLTHELCRKLARGRMGARRLRLLLERSDGSSAAIEVGFSAPSRDPLHLLRLIEEKTVNLDLGFGVDRMLLVAPVAEASPLLQTSLAPSREKAEVEPLIDKLANRLGLPAIRRLSPQASHLPERAQRLKSAFNPAVSWLGSETNKPPRPALLLTPPEALEVIAEIPEGPPARFTWRRVSRRVVKAEGPERIAPEWWHALWKKNSEARPRDYYRIEDQDGHRYWVFREGLYQDNEAAPVWYLHGVF
jgi:protein ImuB